MAQSIEIPSIDNQTPLLLPADKTEVQEEEKVDHVIEVEVPPSALDELVLQLRDWENKCIKSTTIFKVNAGLRTSNPDAYTPMFISIGPYHKRNPALRLMEKYKLLYLQRFLKRKGALDMKSCIDALEKKKDEALKCYDDNALDSYIVRDLDFSVMLLLDGCFVVEFIRECNGVDGYRYHKIINLEWMTSQVCRDMVLLENQLPFFVLTMLHNMIKDDAEKSFLDMVRETLIDTFPKAKFIPQSEIDNFKAEQFDHLVHAVHVFCRPTEDQTKAKQNTNSSSPNECCKISFCGSILQLTKSKETPKVLDIWQCYHIPTARELFASGVSFLKIGSVEVNEKDKATLFDIKFEKGLMQIPCFAIEDTMETFMRNLIAYEQHSSRADVYPYFSNYAHIMTQLIGSHRDVNFLRQNKIILKDIGDDKEVASIFKKLSDGVTVTDFYYKDECSKLIQHCEKPWNEMMASLRHNYFQSPWAGASTVAAITLLILTVIQTVLAFNGVDKK